MQRELDGKGAGGCACAVDEDGVACFSRAWEWKLERLVQPLSTCYDAHAECGGIIVGGVVGSF